MNNSQVWLFVFEIPVLVRKRQEDHWCKLASQSNLFGKFQANKRPCHFKKESEWHLKNDT